MKKKIIAIALCAALAVGGVVAGSLAFLTDTSEQVVNTFTAGDVAITLEEYVYDSETGSLTSETTQENEYKMIPGNTLPKDPFITIDANSEDCYVFVKVEGLNDASTYLSYQMADGWVAVDEATYPGVYYNTEIGKANDVFHVLKDNQVTVNSAVTSAQMELLNGKTNDQLPQLKFTAYAVQKDNIDNAVQAWAEFNA